MICLILENYKNSMMNHGWHKQKAATDMAVVTM